MLLYSIIATLLVSLVSLTGIVSLAFRQESLKKILILMVGFAAGSMIGAVFLHILPETVENHNSRLIFLFVVLGFVFFFILERYFYWRHCHKGVCDLHAFTYLNLIGDGIHNFCDGMMITMSFSVDFKVGIVTTLAILFHEIPQELSDFGVLVYGGFSKFKALFYNFLSAFACVFGAVVAYFVNERIIWLPVFLLPFTAGGFIYIAGSDLIPELHREKDAKRANYSILSFFAGIVFMWFASIVGRI